MFFPLFLIDHKLGKLGYSWKCLLLQHQCGVPGVDEESVQDSLSDGGGEPPWSAQGPRKTGRLTGEDTEGSGRVPGTRKGLIPQVTGGLVKSCNFTRQHLVLLQVWLKCASEQFSPKQ